MNSLPPKSNNSIRDQIFTAIQSGQVAMRPRWHFVLRGVLLASGSIFLVLALVYLASFILFMLRQSGAFFVPIFGSRGWYAFFLSAPWLLIILAAIFIVALEFLVRHYSFAYRRPLLYSVATILLLVTVGGSIVAATPFHRRLSNWAEHDRLPFGGDLYRQMAHPHFGDIHRGTIMATTSFGFIFKDDHSGEIMSVVVNSHTRLPLGAEFEGPFNAAGDGMDLSGLQSFLQGHVG